MPTPYYEQDGITIYHGDCREILPSLPTATIDLVFTSPPYNLREGMDDKGGLRVGHPGSAWKNTALVSGYGEHTDDLPYPEYIAWQHDTLTECWRLLSRTGAIYYNHKPRVVKGILRHPFDLNPGLPLRQVVVWARGGGINYGCGHYVPTHELILIFAKPAFTLKAKSASAIGDVWTVPAESNNPHPAPFPVGLPTRAMDTTPAGVVLDPFMGSGTTLRAAKDCGRKAIGIELNEAYCEIAAKRLRQAVLPMEATA